MIKAIRASEENNHYSQPTKRCRYSDLVFDGTTHLAPVVNMAGVKEDAKAVSLLSTGSSANLYVHLIDDFDTNGAMVLTPLELVAGDPKTTNALVFDYVSDTVAHGGVSTVAFDANLMIWL